LLQSKDYPRLFPKIEAMQNMKPVIQGTWHFYADGRPFAWRLFRGSDDVEKPLLVFCHGFKGFIDWGGFPAIMQGIADAGFHVFQFNFSLNGTLPAQPDTFCDLAAFRRNTLGREVQELLSVCSQLLQGAIPQLRFNGIVLGGHSRGGYIAGAAAGRIPQLRGVFTMAAVVKMRERLLRHDPEKWRQEGAVAELNARTGQIMEMGYSLWQDFENDEHDFFKESLFMPARIPLLMVHGSADAVVPLSDAHYLHRKRNNAHTFLLEIPGADHTFGMKHPLPAGPLPQDALKAMQAGIDFLRRC
jgi:pimeloyl-ACP methyl ester carboxylesterase